MLKRKRVDLPAIARGERGERIPLSFAQQRLWFLAQMEGVSEAYHIPFGLRLRGDLDRGALRRALSRIIARHEVLRTTFIFDDGEPTQRIHSVEESPFHLLEQDLRRHPDAEAELNRLAALEASSSFDLEQGPLIRGRLIQMGEEDHALLVTLHHIVSDGWSMGVWIRELKQLYRAFQQGESDPLPELEIQYADYAVWQRKWVEGDILQRQAEYWRETLAGAPALLELPADHGRPGQQDYTGAFARVVLDEKLTAGLKELSRRHGTTMFMTLLGAWAVLLARLSGQQDIVIGTPVANRGQAEIENLIGFFVNTLALRVDLSDSPTVGEMLARVKARALTAQQHQDIPFEQVVELARPVRSLAHSPLFQVMFTWQNADGFGSAASLPGLQVQRLPTSPHVVSKFDITLLFEETPKKILGRLEYATALFKVETIERYLSYFRNLLEAMVGDDTQVVDRLPILPEGERNRVLYEWNDTATEYPSDLCIQELFEQQVEKNPEAVAVVYEDRELSYGELNRQANRLAHHLRELGVGPDARVAICMERSLEMIVALLAVLKAGGAYVPLDPAYPAERLRFMLEDSDPVVLLIQGPLRQLYTELNAALPVLDLNDSAAWQSRPDTNPDPASIGLTPEHLAYIIYTSGSTGMPKGVAIEHKSLANLVTAQIQSFAVDSESRVLQLASFSFDACVSEIFTALGQGASLHLAGQRVKLAGEVLIQLIGRNGITHATLPPGLLATIPEHSRLYSVRTLITAGEALAGVLARRWTAGRRLINAYGPTETTVCATLHDCIAEETGNPPIGRPIANTQVYILDGSGQPVPVGVAGELYIGGAGVARGYRNRAELTAERFLPDPFSKKAGARMYRTGDLGRWLTDGNIEFLGRNDFQVKIRGFRIELGEIEARLMEHPGVGEAVVIAREDTPGDKRLVAYWRAADREGSESAGAESLRAYLSAVLPEYMVPAAYVLLDSLPLTPNGKLDRKALPAPDGDAYVTRGYEAPVGETETILATIWAEVLKLDRVGRNDNFFELGGHSLLAVRVVTRLRQAFSVEVAINDLFAQPILADLAERVGSGARVDLPAIARGERGERIPLSFAQQRLWFLAQMEGVSEAYHIPFGLRLRGDLDRGALRRALSRIIARHEVLRTTFIFDDGEPTQRIHSVEESPFHLLEQDLRRHPDAEAELNRLAALEASSSFDLEQGPLIRGRLIQMGEEDHALLVTLHHIVSDGWSMGVWIRELKQLYRAFQQGESDPLPELEIQYADYAVWQRKWVEGDILQRQAEYWRETLAGAPALLELPADHGRPGQQDYTGAFARVVLDEKLTAGLKELSRRHGTTMFMTLLGAWAVLLARLSGQQDIVIGTPVANRGQAEIENLIGFFVNTLALRVDLSDSPTVGEMLARVKARALTAQQHQDIPFEQVVELARPVRSLAHSPLFQVMFTWQNADAPEDRFALAGLTLKPLESESYLVSKFDLTLSLEEGAKNISGGLEYATALFKVETIERYLSYFRNLLEAMVGDDTQVVDRLPILPEGERNRVLYEWNDTATEYPSDLCIQELFEQQVEKNPEAVAVVYEDRELSYGELNRQANRLAHHLRELGVGPDARVAICMERSLEMIVALLAVLKAGGAYVPLDPAYPAERLRFMLEDSDPVVLLIQGPLRQLYTELNAALPVLDLNDSAAWQSRPDTNPDPASIGLTPEHLAYIIYTSGSTGMPKGVAIEHKSLANLVYWHLEAFELKNEQRSSSVAGFGFDAATWEIWPTLCIGATLLMPFAADAKDPEALLAWWGKQNLDVSFLPTPLAESAFTRGITNSHLHTLLIGGDRLHSRPLQSTFSIVNNYGPTEATVVATSGRIDPSATVLPIGRPIANTQVYILDGSGQPVPVGVAGELYIGGAGVARGYRNRAELTAERFLPDPFSKKAGARMYRTGDLGRWLTDGNIEFLGRNDFQVKIRGFRIELGEIEARLMEHPGVGEAVVIAREDTPGDKRLVAYWRAADREGSESAGAESLRAYLSAVLPEYMVPAAYVLLDSLPLTPNGKLDRKALPAPDGDAYVTRGYEAPVGETETILATIWAEVLKLDRVGRNDNFFELGGHSLLAVTLIERMRRTGLEVDVRALFATPTLAALAASVTADSDRVEAPPNRIPSGCSAITPEMLPLVKLTEDEIDQIVRVVSGGAANVQDIYPLAPLQEGILFHHLMGGEGDPYLLGTLLGFDSRTRLDGYLCAMQAVVDRHDILRTAVLWEGLPEPVQVVLRQASLHIEEIALDSKSGNVAKQLYARYDPRQFRIDIRQAPLLRIHLAYDSKQDRWLVLQLLHHLAGDHSTLEVMQEEIQAHLLGKADELPTPLPFRNLVAQARLGISPEEHEVFFRKLLGDVDEPTTPFGLLDVQRDGTGIEEAHMDLDSSLARRIRSHARRLGVSAASLCHLAWGQVLARVSGREDVVFGTVLFGRMQGGTGSDRVMGLFINTLPVRIHVGEEGVEASIRRTHTQLAELMRHEHASLALAQRCSAVPAPMPLFSALLNYRHSPGAAQTPSAEAMQAWQGIQGLRGEERTNYPITLSVEDMGEGLGLTAQVPPSIQPLRICQFMRTALTSLVEALEMDPATAVRTLEVLPEGERNRVLYEWNDTATEYPSDLCIQELFEQQVEKNPEAVAVVYEDRELSYGELNRQANRLAHHLRELGVGPDARVAICMERSLEMIVALLAVLKAGGAYVPLDPAYPAERLRFMLEDSDPVVLLIQGPLRQLYTELNAALPVLDLNDSAAWQSRPDTNPDPASIGLTPEHLAYIIYTSGSTGMPKGVMVEHRNVARLFSATQPWFHLDANDVWTLFHSYAFDFSVWEIWGALLHGGRLIVVLKNATRSPEDFYQLLCREGVTILNQTPSAFRQLILAQGKIGSSHRLRHVILGGEALEVAILKPWYEQNQDQPTQLINMYGITETTVHVTYRPLEPADAEHRGSPIGCRIPDLQVYILDGSGQPVPVGVAGELYIGGAGVARGYRNRAELTAERFLPDPFSKKAGARMYRTGDLGRWLTDGNIEFLGRNDFQVKIRGFRIELGEIEARLMEHPGVGEAVVIAREDTPGDKRLVAYWRAADREGSESAGAESLRAYLSAVLPEYMVPAAYVLLDSLPLTPNGKLDRKALPAPDGDAYVTRGYEAPVGETETILATIWAEVLKLDRVGRNDNFFELGGHSLLAVRVVTRLRQAFSVEVAINDLFAQPILADLAERVGSGARVDLPAIARGERGERIPLSFAQQRLWFLAQMEGVSEAYHIPFGLRLRGDLDRGALRRALSRIIARHEVLRTTFIFDDGEPTQRIHSVEESPFHLLEQDLRRHPDAEAELNRLAALEASSSFDLEQGPLIRGRLIQMGEEDHALLVTLHHIVSDGWSMGVWIRELKQLYRAFQQGESDPLPELEIQYADYAVWQRKWVEGDILQRQAEYWRETLAGAPALLELPADHGRPGQQDYTGAFARVVLDEKLTAGLKELSRRHGTTMFMTLLGAWAVLLARLSGQQDIVIGTPVANRGQAEIENLIGFFVNTLALRVDLSDSPTVGEMLARVKARALTAQQHQDIPFEQVVELARPVRSLAHSPLFQVMFTWQNADAPEDRFALAGLTLKPLESESYLVSKFDLTLSLEEGAKNISGGLEYATALFKVETIERYLSYFRNLLEAMVGDDTQVVDRLPILPEGERNRVLYEWNDTATEYPSDLCIQELFEQQVEKNPEAVAVVYEDRELSYGELNRQANRLAHHLRELGVGPDARVAICMERSLEMIVALLAVLKAGGAYVPLDPAYPAERLRFMLEDSDPVVLLIQGPLRQLYTELNAALPVLDLNDSAAWQSRPDTNPDPASIGLTPEHLAYIIYTSGSTGMPKGVAIEHKSLANLVTEIRERYKLGSDDRILQFASLNFDTSVEEIFGAFVSGALLQLRNETWLTGVLEFWNLCEKHRISVLNLPTRFWRVLLLQERTVNIPACVRLIIIGGEAVEQNGFTVWFQRDRHRPALINAYGPTETTVTATACEITRDIATWKSIGRPIANTQVYILDGSGQPVPVGVAGELYIGGAGVARGYRNRAELTAERFLPDPFSKKAGARMYRTGDLGRWLTDGNIEFLGRNDFQVKIRGFRIELGEIEARLMEHPGVGEAVVIAREDTPGDKRLVAYWRAADREGSESAGAESLRAYLSAVLPEYMVPAAYVLLDSLPLTPNGKLDRKALPAPDGDAYVTRGYEAPVGETETILATIWAEVLKLDRVGRNDNFFELGGHSLLAVTLIERMRRTGLEVDVRALFATPTLAALAASVTADSDRVEAPPNRIPSGCSAITPEMLPLVKLTEDEIDQIVRVVSGGAANVQDIYPLAPLQEGILFHHLMGGEGDPYLLGTLLGFDSRTRLDGYLCAMQAVVDRHDILRTAVLWEGLPEPVQVVLRQASLHIEEIALDSKSGNVAKQLYARYDPRQFRIDIRQAPLLRIHLAYDSKQDRWLVLQLLHHLAGDHSTLEVMQEEIQAHLLGKADELPTPLPFRNLVAQARLGISPEEHEVFFRKLLGDVDEPTTPFGLLDVQRDGTGIEEAHMDLDSSLARRIRSHARRLGVSAASLCHLAWGQVLARVSGREDVVFGTVLFGRMQGGTGSDRVMGLFINTLPVRIHVGEEGVEASIRRTHTQLAELMRHEHASLALAQRCSAVPAPMPLFSALLNYRHSPGAAQTPSAEAMQAWQGIQGLRGEERTNYPITLSVEDMGEGLGLTAQVPPSIQPLRICQFMRTALTSLVEALEMDPATAVRTLEVLPEGERNRVLYEWNDTATEYPSDLCIQELFEQQVEKNPEAVAVVYEDRELSYGELNRQANRLAHHLRELGVGPDARVAICMERSLEMIVALLAVLKAGGAYVPLDPAYPAERLRFMLEDSDPVVLLIQGPLRQLYTELNAALPVLDLNDSAAWQSRPDTNPDPASIGLTPEHLAYIIYTSGSTGMPKGVMVEHRNVARLFSATQPWFHLDANDVWTLFHSYAFDFSVWEIWGALLHGGRLIVVLKNATRSPEDFYQLLCREGVTILNQTPSAFRQLILAQGKIGSSHRLRHVILGGEALEVAILKPWYEQNQDQPTQLINMYGITETTVHVTYRPLEPADAEHRGSPIGCRIPDLQVYILDGSGQPVPVGVAGELYIGGAGVARGYRNRAELTAERFLPDPFSKKAGARMYRTGDLGRWLTDGNIEFLGRNDFQVKIRGFRIELGEIEARLMEHPGVGEAVVIAREDTPGDKRLVAYWRAADREGSESAGAESLRAYLSAVLPEYMVPAAYVLLDSLPLTPNGKLDRKALPAPDGDAYVTRGYEAPVGETETILATIWAEVLKLDRVGRNDNFFELGGHSLLAVRVVTRLRQAFSVEVAINDLFAQPILADLAERVVFVRLEQFDPEDLAQVLKLMESF